jgi:hypothetical protein
MPLLKVPANYYQQFDADFSLEYPGEGYGGWKRAEVELDLAHTGFVVMHAWDCGTREEYPGWHRAVEYIPRSYAICKEVFPVLLGAIRGAGLPLFHVVGSGSYCSDYPGYKRSVALAADLPRPAPEPQVAADPSLEALRKFRAANVFVGTHNEADVRRGGAVSGFAKGAFPEGDEGIAENGAQLFALCREAGVNHLVYSGFAINWCLLLSPGGMAEISKYGVMCSAFRQAVTAVENKESCRHELYKEEGLWRTALSYGFVFDVDDFVEALRR